MVPLADDFKRFGIHPANDATELRPLNPMCKKPLFSARNAANSYWASDPHQGRHQSD
jgi:hypothetical protein